MTQTTKPPDDAHLEHDTLQDDFAERFTTLRKQTHHDNEGANQGAILKTLGNEKRACNRRVPYDDKRIICEPQTVLNTPQSTIGTYLRRLKNSGIVRSNKEGVWGCYRIANTATFDLPELTSVTQEEKQI